MGKTMAIVGLGLIGGSMAMALHGFEEYELLGVDVSQPTLRYALEHGIVDRVSDNAEEALSQADVVFLCMHPQGIVNFLHQYIPLFGRNGFQHCARAFLGKQRIHAFCFQAETKTFFAFITFITFRLRFIITLRHSGGCRHLFF